MKASVVINPMRDEKEKKETEKPNYAKRVKKKKNLERRENEKKKTWSRM